MHARSDGRFKEIKHSHKAKKLYRIQAIFFGGSSSIKDNVIILIQFRIKVIQPVQINKLSVFCTEINKLYLVSIFSAANVRFQFKNQLKLVLQIRTLFVGNKAKVRITKPCVSGGNKCWFFEKFGMLCFLVTSVLRFALLPYYQPIHI